MLNRVTARDTDYHFNLGSPSTRGRIPDQPATQRRSGETMRQQNYQQRQHVDEVSMTDDTNASPVAWTTVWYCMEMDLLHLLHSITNAPEDASQGLCCFSVARIVMQSNQW